MPVLMSEPDLSLPAPPITVRVAPEPPPQTYPGALHGDIASFSLQLRPREVRRSELQAYRLEVAARLISGAFALQVLEQEGRHMHTSSGAVWYCTAAMLDPRQHDSAKLSSHRYLLEYAIGSGLVATHSLHDSWVGVLLERHSELEFH